MCTSMVGDAGAGNKAAARGSAGLLSLQLSSPTAATTTKKSSTFLNSNASH